VGRGHDSCVDKQLNDWKMFGRKFNEAPKTGYVTAVITTTTSSGRKQASIK